MYKWYTLSDFIRRQYMAKIISQVITIELVVVNVVNTDGHYLPWPLAEVHTFVVIKETSLGPISLYLSAPLCQDSVAYPVAVVAGVKNGDVCIAILVVYAH